MSALVPGHDAPAAGGQSAVRTGRRCGRSRNRRARQAAAVLQRRPTRERRSVRRSRRCRTGAQGLLRQESQRSCRQWCSRRRGYVLTVCCRAFRASERRRGWLGSVRRALVGPAGKLVVRAPIMSTMTGTDRRTRPRPRLAGAAFASLPVVLALVAGACGTTDKASTDPLPPIRTTTSTTTIPGTTLPEGVRQFYTIKRGDTLASIAGCNGRHRAVDHRVERHR